MCLLIFKPAGKSVPREMLYNADQANSDGCGVAYYDGERIVIKKGLYKFDGFYDTFIKPFEEKDMIIHFRNASAQMEISDAMCHPFPFDDKKYIPEGESQRFRFAMGHNGKLAWRDTNKKSDTACFTEDVLEHILGRDPWFLDNEVGVKLLEMAIGFTNKMVIMRHDATPPEGKHPIKFYIINRDGGYGDRKAHWKDGVWYSNESYKPPFKATHGAYQAGWDYMNGDHGGYAGPPTVSSVTTTTKNISSPDLTKSGSMLSMANSSWSLPDEYGWYWDFNLHGWRNKNTQHFQANLASRPDKPAYMKNRERWPKPTVISPFPNATKGSEDAPKTIARLDLMNDEEWKLWLAHKDEQIDQKVIQLKAETGPAPIEKKTKGVDNVILSHLGKTDKKVLRRAAADYIKTMTGDKNTKRLTNSEMIVWLRNDVRELLPHTKQMDDAELDIWLIDKTKKGMDLVDMMERQNEVAEAKKDI